MTFETSTVRNHNARLAAIVAILLAGVMTGAQLGKIAPLIPWYQQSLGFSLVAAGWIAAILGIFIAAAALPAGWAIDRLGLLRSIAFGATALIFGGVALAAAAAPPLVFAARLVEAVGYLALCIALPAALNAISPVSWKGPVLAIWSGFVPLGFAASDFLASAMLPSFAPPVFLLTMTGLFAIASCGALGLMPGFTVAGGAGASGGLAATLSRRVLLLAISFGVFVVLSLSMFTFMPAFVAGAGGHYLVSAGAIALSVPLGNVLAGVLVRGHGARAMAVLGIVGFAVSALAAVPAFSSQSPAFATLAALALAVSGALVASSQFAAIPFVTPRGGSVAMAIGLVCQAGGLGTVFGPPIGAAVIEAAGWHGFGIFLAAVSLAGIAAMAPLALGGREDRLSVAGAPPVP